MTPALRPRFPSRRKFGHRAVRLDYQGVKSGRSIFLTALITDSPMRPASVASPTLYTLVVLSQYFSLPLSLSLLASAFVFSSLLFLALLALRSASLLSCLSFWPV